LREFSEETLGSFGDITNNIDSSLAVFDRAMLIIFVKVDCNPFQINTIFSRKLANVNKPEVNKLIWIGIDRFKELIDTGDDIIYDRVQKCLNRAQDFWSYLQKK